MTAKTLRELARAYAKGELARDDYRRSRSGLVGAILAGEVEVRAIDFPPPLKPPGGEPADATEPRPRRTRQSEPPTTDTQPAPAAREPAPRPAAPATAGNTGSGIWLGAGVVLLLIIGGAVYLLTGSKPAQAPDTTTAAAARPAATPAANSEAKAGRDLIGAFLDDRNWSAARMQAFKSDWSTLTPEQQGAALASVEAGRLVSAIHQRLLEEKALSGLGDPQSSLAKQRELVEFAGAIGITDARIAVPDMPAAAEAATAAD